jgi:dUTP pyrophosphatase
LTTDFKIINNSNNALPNYQTALAAGMDICAFLDDVITLQPMQRYAVPTGIFIEIPAGFEVQLRPRSGLAFKQGITLLNSPGTIDADYRGEIKVLVINLSNEIQKINSGERIAQMVVAKHETIQWNQVEYLEESERGQGGFGSTGK